MPRGRTNEYYEDRLKREHPGIYADFKAGRIPSIRQAAAKAGIKKLPTSLTHLKREWAKASGKERRAFVKWARQQLPSGGSALPAHASAARSPVKPVFDADGRLTPDAVAFLTNWTVTHRLSACRILVALGRSRHDYRLGQAINQGNPLSAEIAPGVERWMRAEGF
jgi:hypothetical protein